MGLFFALFVWPVASGLPHALVTLEILHLALMLLGRSAAPERAEVAALAAVEGPQQDAARDALRLLYRLARNAA